MKRALVIVPLLIIAGGIIFLVVRHREPAEENKIRISGNIEINEAALSFNIPGRISERRLSEGNRVKAGEVVATLDQIDLRQEVDLKQAEVDVLRAALREFEAGSRPEEIDQAEAVLARAKAEGDRWDREYQRQQDLFAKEVISARELESAQMSYETAVTRIDEAGQALKLKRKGPRKEQIEQARARVRQSEEALALAQTRLGYAMLTSPVDGLVLSEGAEAGEYVTAGSPVVTVGDMDPVWLRAYINETDLGRVRVGQAVSITTDSYPGKVYAGTVSFISSQSEFTPKNVQTEKERVTLVYRIKIDVANPEMELKPGMPADGEIVLSAESR